MILEWLRRNEPIWSTQMDTYLYTEAPITEVEEIKTGGGAPKEAGSDGPGPKPARFTVGPLKD